MAVIPQGIESLYSTILSYLSLLLTIAFFAKIVQLIGGIRGRRGSNNNRNGNRNNDDGANDDGSNNPSGNRHNPYTHLDPTRNGTAQFKIITSDGTPVDRARVTMAANRHR